MLPNIKTELAQSLDTTDEFDVVPANDNDCGFSYVDIPGNPANDNYEDDDHLFVDHPRWYRYVHAEPGRLEQLLARAGYDPELVDEEHRHTAFEVALCFEKGLFAVDEIAEALSFTREEVLRAFLELRVAAKPGTRVG
jgi:hypothetical protein